MRSATSKIGNFLNFENEANKTKSLKSRNVLLDDDDVAAASPLSKVSLSSASTPTPSSGNQHLARRPSNTPINTEPFLSTKKQRWTPSYIWKVVQEDHKLLVNDLKAPHGVSGKGITAFYHMCTFWDFVTISSYACALTFNAGFVNALCLCIPWATGVDSSASSHMSKFLFV